LKLIKSYRKSLLATLLILAILASTLIMAVPVAAAAFDINIVAGANNVAISAATFNGMPTISMDTAYANASYSRNINTGTAAVGTYNVVMTTSHSIYGFKAGESVTIKQLSPGILQETNTIASIDPATRTLVMTNPLANDYAGGTVNAVMVYDTWVGVPVKDLIDAALGTSYDGTGYSIVAFASDGYPVMAGPTSTGTNIDTTGANTIMVAKSKDGIAMTSGGTLACTNFTAGNQFDSGLTRIELVYAQKATGSAGGVVGQTGFTWPLSSGNKQGPNPWLNYSVIPVSLSGSATFGNPTFSITANSGYLTTSVLADSVAVVPPPASYTFASVATNHTLVATFALPVVNVSISPPSQAVANGAAFNVNLAISTDTATRGWSANVTFDATRMSCTGVTEGTFLSAYAASNLPGGTVSGGAVTIDNVAGFVTIPGYALTNAGTSGPTGSGNLCNISFTAKAAIDNFASITVANAIVSDVNAASIPGVTLTGGQVAIGNVPMADLVVSAASTAKVNDTSYTITYTITNQGNADAAATSVSIVIDGGTPIVIPGPALPAAATNTQTTVSQTLSAPSDTIVVTADSTNAVSESNETNNTRTLTYANVSGTGDTIVDGNIAAKLEFTAPSNIDQWNLVVGSNDRSGTMNVKCNSAWQVQVSDQNATTAGYMTKWMSNTYVPGTKLAAPLTVGCTTNVDLSGTPQTIVNGTPAGQSGNSGQNCTVLYHQAILYSDTVLTGGYSYHIVITFTASVTI
jgi:hypothetical protein